VLPVMVQKITEMLNLKNSLDFREAINEETIKTIKIGTIRASLSQRILSWSRNSIGLLKKIIHSSEFIVQKNAFQEYFRKGLELFVKKLKEDRNIDFDLKSDYLMQSKNIPFLSGTADYVINDCKKDPILVIELKFLTSKKQFVTFISEKPGNQFEIIKNHEYYTQMQMYCNIFNVGYCILILLYNDDMYVAEIQKETISEETLGKLSSFYLFYLLPKLILQTNPSKKRNGFRYFDLNEEEVIKNEIQENEETQELLDFSKIFKFVSEYENIYKFIKKQRLRKQEINWRRIVRIFDKKF